MNLHDIVTRHPDPVPFGNYPNLPWDELEFSKRMLKEHLSQAHDAASRRIEIIDHHVAWIQETFLQETPGNILDLCCGPGFYTSRLTYQGHHCRGIDFSPASVAYAREQAERESLSCGYHEGNVIKTDYDSGYNLVMMISGEFNTFSPDNARKILNKAYHALSDSGYLLLEPQPYDFIKTVGQREREWFTGESDLYLARPYIGLKDYSWHESLSATAERYFLVDAQSAEVSSFVISRMAYTEDSLRDLLHDVGFVDVTFYDNLSPEPIAKEDYFFAVSARKPE